MISLKETKLVIVLTCYLIVHFLRSHFIIALPIKIINLKISHSHRLDITEVPICESAISCDNLLCDGHGRAPNPSVVVQVTAQNRIGWIKYSRTEVIEVSSLAPQIVYPVALKRCRISKQV